ncbi:transposase [Streptomyces violascens]|uniref:transposase n=1 Tax=Streptomyces violascens TaxID=67381 RepID=UPI0036516DF0
MSSITRPTAPCHVPAGTDEEIVLGVDPHKDVHAAAVISVLGVALHGRTFPTTNEGYSRLVAWARSFGTLRRAGVECTGSYGAALTRHLRAEGIWLAALPLPATARSAVADRLEVIDALQVVIDRLDAALARAAKEDPRVKALTALPGIGPLAALIILAEVGDIRRFPSARKLASWAGLTPTVRGSDRTVRYGHISKQGDPWLRWIMNQAAQTAKRTPPYASCFEQIAHRRGRKIATIAIARKLLTHAYHVLRELDAAQPSKEPCTTA